MIGALPARSCLAGAPEASSGPPDGFRKLDELDLSASWGDFPAELPGGLDLERRIFGREDEGDRPRPRKCTRAAPAVFK
jgi:hypothetical protein